MTNKAGMEAAALLIRIDQIYQMKQENISCSVIAETTNLSEDSVGLIMEAIDKIGANFDRNKVLSYLISKDKTGDKVNTEAEIITETQATMRLEDMELDADELELLRRYYSADKLHREEIRISFLEQNKVR
jgi:hypothetical protein